MKSVLFQIELERNSNELKLAIANLLVQKLKGKFHFVIMHFLWHEDVYGIHWMNDSVRQTSIFCYFVISDFDCKTFWRELYLLKCDWISVMVSFELLSEVRKFEGMSLRQLHEKILMVNSCHIILILYFNTFIGIFIVFFYQCCSKSWVVPRENNHLIEFQLIEIVFYAFITWSKFC